MEVEIKAKIDNPKEFEKRITSLGAKFIKEVVEEDLYFSHPCRDFKTSDEALRIRNGNEITYKGPKVDKITKSREEINVKISDAESMVLLLKKLGFTPVAKIKKRRRYYRLDDLTISIDKVSGLGVYVEVECMGDYNYCLSRVVELKEKLKLKESIRESYLEMLIGQRGIT